LRFLEAEIREENIEILETGDNPPAPPPKEIIVIEETLGRLEAETKECKGNYEALKRNFVELQELKHVLQKTEEFFKGSDSNLMEDVQNVLGSDIMGAEEGGPAAPRKKKTGDAFEASLGFVTGVIDRIRLPHFERLLWRACHGNVYFKAKDIEESSLRFGSENSDKDVPRSIFIIFFQGDLLKIRVNKICDGFHATLYPCPVTSSQRRDMTAGVLSRIEEVNIVLGQSLEHRQRILLETAKGISPWIIKGGFQD
jgi:V-type H+-transporting ATPase subunit a